ncbi:MAG: hypothetical protein PHN64_05890 [Desulfovibrionaceae bacterium]|nr:hypothetical protein [Desulfovibrionaceae bacterium]
MPDKDNEISTVVQAVLEKVPSVSGVQQVRATLFLVRRELMNLALAPYAEAPLSWQRKARQNLPPLVVPLDDALAYPLGWLHTAAVIFLTLAAAGALWQGLGLASVPLGGLLGLAFIALCTAGLLRLAEKISQWEVLLLTRPQVQAAAQKAEAALPPNTQAKEDAGQKAALKERWNASWQKKGLVAWLVWKNLRRLVFFFVFLRGNVRLALWCIFGAALCFALLRDFVLGRPVLETFLAGINSLLTQGTLWPLFSSFYGFWLWLALWLMLLSLPKRLNKAVAQARIAQACQTWYETAQAMLRLQDLAHKPEQSPAGQRLEALGQDVYSFAHELSAERRDWLIERLRDLGLEFEESRGEMLWHEALAEHYDKLGIIHEGDPCFVDRVPEMKEGVVLRKGLLRKVRR